MDINIRCIHRLHPIRFNESVNQFALLDEKQVEQISRKYDTKIDSRYKHDIGTDCSPSWIKRSCSQQNSLISISCPLLKDKSINEMFKTPSLLNKMRPKRRSSSFHDLKTRFSSNSRVYSSQMIRPFKWINKQYQNPRKSRSIKVKKKNNSEDEEYNRDVQVFYSSDNNRKKRYHKSRRKIQNHCDLDLCNNMSKIQPEQIDSSSFDNPAGIGCPVRECFSKEPSLPMNDLQTRARKKIHDNDSSPARCECSLPQQYNTVNFPDSSSNNKVSSTNHKRNKSNNNICQCIEKSLSSSATKAIPHTSKLPPNISDSSSYNKVNSTNHKPNKSKKNICKCFEKLPSLHHQPATKTTPPTSKLPPKEADVNKAVKTLDKEPSTKPVKKLDKTKWFKLRTRKFGQLLSKIRTYRIPRYPICLLKNALKCILFSVIIIVWSPCIIVMYFCWVLTYPLRPKHVNADMKFQKLDFWGKITNLVTKKLGGIYNILTHFTRAEQCNKSRDPNRRLSRKSLLRETRSQKLISQKSMLLKQKDVKQFNNKLCLKTNPDPKMRYTLYHSPSRGWLLKPLSSRVIEPDLQLEIEEKDKNDTTNHKNISFVDEDKRLYENANNNHRCECLKGSENTKLENKNNASLTNKEEYIVSGQADQSSRKSSEINKTFRKGVEDPEVVRTKDEYQLPVPPDRYSRRGLENNRTLLSKQKHSTPETSSRKDLENNKTLLIKQKYSTLGTSSRKGLHNNKTLLTKEEYVVPGPSNRTGIKSNKTLLTKEEYLIPGPSNRKRLENNKTLLSKEEYLIPGPSNRKSLENNEILLRKEEYLLPGSSNRKGLENNTLLSKEEYIFPAPSNRKSKENNEILLRKEEYLLPGLPNFKGSKNNKTLLSKEEYIMPGPTPSLKITEKNEKLLTKEEYYIPGPSSREGLEKNKILLSKEEYLIPGPPSRFNDNKSLSVEKKYSVTGASRRKRIRQPTVIEIDPTPNKIYKSSSAIEHGQKWIPRKKHLLSPMFLKSLQNRKSNNHKRIKPFLSPKQSPCLCISKSPSEKRISHSDSVLMSSKQKNRCTVLVNLKNLKLHKNQIKYEDTLKHNNFIEKPSGFKNESRNVHKNERKIKHRNQCRECIYEYEDACGNKCTKKFKKGNKRDTPKTRDKKSKCSYKYRKKHQKNFRKTCGRKCKKKFKNKSQCLTMTYKQVIAVLKLSKQTVWGWFNDGGKDWPRSACRDIYVNTLRSRPCFFIYRCWPSFYPYFLTLCNFNKNALHGLCLVLSACVWCPIFFCCYICFLMCNCCDC